MLGDGLFYVDVIHACIDARHIVEFRDQALSLNAIVTCEVLVSPIRAEAVRNVGTHYTALFGEDPQLDKLREAYAIPTNSIKSAERQHTMNAFFF